MCVRAVDSCSLMREGGASSALSAAACFLLHSVGFMLNEVQPPETHGAPVELLCRFTARLTLFLSTPSLYTTVGVFFCTTGGG